MEVVQIFKYLLMIIIVAMLGLNIFAYLARGTEIASDTLRKLVRFTERVTGQLFRTTITGTKTGLKAVETGVDDLERVVDGGLKRKGFCFIGENKCIGVTDTDICMSGDIFPTMDVCINPKLRSVY